MKWIVLLSVVFISLSGCIGVLDSGETETPTPDLGWNIDIYVEDVEARENGRLHGSIAAGGFIHGGFYGVHVVLLNEEFETVGEVSIGNLTGVEVSHFNTTVPTLPLYITATIERADHPQPRNGHINGRYIHEDGEHDLYREFDYENITRGVASTQNNNF